MSEQQENGWLLLETENQNLRTIIEQFLNKWWGPRCLDFEPDCDGCKRWAALDQLTHLP